MRVLAKRCILTRLLPGKLLHRDRPRSRAWLLLRAEIDPKLCRMQDKAMVTARELAANWG